MDHLCGVKNRKVACSNLAMDLFLKKACTMEMIHFRQSSPTINSITPDRGVTRPEFRGLDMMINSVTNSQTSVEITMTYHFY